MHIERGFWSDERWREFAVFFIDGSKYEIVRKCSTEFNFVDSLGKNNKKIGGREIFLRVAEKTAGLRSKRPALQEWGDEWGVFTWVLRFALR